MKLFTTVLKSHYKNIGLFFISINIIILTTSLVVFDNQLKFMEKTVQNNIIEYDEIDREHICGILECKQVIIPSKQKAFIRNKQLNVLSQTEYSQKTIFKLWRNIVIMDHDIAFFNIESKSYYIIDTQNLFFQLIFVFTLVVPISMVIFIYPMYISIKNEKELAIVQNVGNEALLANKSMIMITENIHHELNTPLEIIDNKIEKIHKVIEDYLIEEHIYFSTHEDDINDPHLARYKDSPRQNINTRLIKLTTDFEFIKTASEQIYNILEKMKGFKHMRYSNGNKTIKDILDSAFKIISISNSNYEHSVDDKLSEYSVNSNSFKNADLLGICINNIKNSLEAQASNILIMFVRFEKGFLTLRIIDNGCGIPDNAVKKIFDPNFSTKSNDNSIRGNGMYLNRQIIRQGGGNTQVVETSHAGTTIELIIPSKMKEMKNENDI